MKILIVDFWSDGNIGDAIMQCEIIKQSSEFSDDIHIVSCFGENQFQLNAFNESLNFDSTTWHPSFFKTYINLDKFSSKIKSGRINRIFRTLLSLFISNLKLKLYKLTKSSVILGTFSDLKNVNFDAIIFNGRNYRDFDGTLKNYINNQPLIIHQKLIAELFPDVPKINAGFSAWQIESKVDETIRNQWENYSLNIARESFTYEFIKSRYPDIELFQGKDLSFDYLSDKTIRKDSVRKKVAFSLTSVSSVDKYIEEINSTLKYYFEKDFEILLIDQVYLEHEHVEDLIKRIEIPFKRISSKKIDSLLSAYSNCEYVISTRMHGSIMALSQGCRVASLAYDDGAKWSIIKDEIPGYPIFRPIEFKAEDVINYLESEQSVEDSVKFLNKVSQSDEKYIEKFLRNINS